MFLHNSFITSSPLHFQPTSSLPSLGSTTSRPMSYMYIFLHIVSFSFSQGLFACVSSKYILCLFSFPSIAVCFHGLQGWTDGRNCYWSVFFLSSTHGQFELGMQSVFNAESIGLVWVNSHPGWFYHFGGVRRDLEMDNTVLQTPNICVVGGLPDVKGVKVQTLCLEYCWSLDEQILVAFCFMGASWGPVRSYRRHVL